MAKQKPVMKAVKYDDKKHADNSGKYIMEPKIDGMRMTAEVKVKEKRVDIRSSTGKLMAYWSSVFDKALLKFAKALGKDCVVFDGEVWDGVSFQTTMEAKGKDADRSKLKYYIFDVIDLADWIAKDSCFQRHRTELLQNNRKHATGNIEVIGSEIMDWDDLEERYDKYLDAGFEGIMIKDPHGVYEWHRSKYWIKRKMIDTYDAQIKEIHEGKGKFKGMAGSITVKGITEDDVFFVSNVNLSSNDVRKEFWRRRKSLVATGAWVEVSAQCLSFKEKRGKVAALRHSKYIRLREPK